MLKKLWNCAFSFLIKIYNIPSTRYICIIKDWWSWSFDPTSLNEMKHLQGQDSLTQWLTSTGKCMYYVITGFVSNSNPPKNHWENSIKSNEAEFESKDDISVAVTTLSWRSSQRQSKVWSVCITKLLNNSMLHVC